MLLAKGLSCYEVLASVLGWLDYYNAINLESKREWNFFIENLRYCMNMQSFYMIYHGPTSSSPPTWLTPTWIHLFYSTKCKKCHWSVTKCKKCKAQDHDIGEHFIYAHDILLPLRAHIFNRAMCEGFPTRWQNIPLCQSSRVETRWC